MDMGQDSVTHLQLIMQGEMAMDPNTALASLPSMLLPSIPRVSLWRTRVLFFLIPDSV